MKGKFFMLRYILLAMLGWAVVVLAQPLSLTQENHFLGIPTVVPVLISDTQLQKETVCMLAIPPIEFNI
jgi:hypothetical protein